MIRAHKAELLRALAGVPAAQERAQQAATIGGTAPPPDRDQSAESRKAHALAYLEDHPDVRRACFADTLVDPVSIVLTVAVREPWGAVEVLISRDRFDPFTLIELASRYADTSLFIPVH